MLRTRALRDHALALAIALVGAIFITWPLARHPATRVPIDIGDPLENAWILSWGAHAIIHQPLALFHANIYYPSQLSLAFAENMLGIAIPAAPVFWLTHNGILMTNVAIIAMYTVTAYGTFRLLLALTKGAVWPSAFGAAAYVATPYRIANVNHLHIVGVYLLPFVLLACLRLHERVRWQWAVALAVLVGAQLWATLTGGLVTLVAVGAWMLWEVVFAHPHWREALVRVGVLAAALVGALVLAAPVILPYIHARQQNPAYTHQTSEVLAFSATPGSYATAPVGGPVATHFYAKLDNRFSPRQGWGEKTLFPGFVLSAAALIGLVLVLVRRRDRALLAVAGLALLMAFGAVLASLGPRWGGKAGGFPLPFLVLSSHVSGLTRVPARFGTLVPFALALLAGVALASLGQHRRNLYAAALIVLVVVEAWPPGFKTVEPPVHITAANRWLSGKKGAVLALPTIQYGPDGVMDIQTLIRETNQIYLSTANFTPLVNGYGAFVAAPLDAITRAVQKFPSDQGFNALKSFGVRWVLVEDDLTAKSAWPDVSAKLAAWPGVRLAKRAGHTEVFDVSGAVTH